MEDERRAITILEAENGYVVSWCRLGYPDSEVIICSTILDTLNTIEKTLIKLSNDDNPNDDN